MYGIFAGSGSVVTHLLQHAYCRDTKLVRFCQVENVLQTIHDYVEAAAVSLRDVFATFDFQGSQRLDFRQFALMLAALIPDVDVGDIRRVVRHVQLMDSDDLAQISYDSVMKVLGFVVSPSYLLRHLLPSL